MSTKEVREFKNVINGEEHASSNGETFLVTSPADNDVKIGVFQQSTDEDLNYAVESAKISLKTWKKMAAPARAEYIYKAAEYVEKHAEDFKTQLITEVGKSYADADAEVIRTIRSMKYMAGEGERLAGETLPAWDPEVRAYTKREAIGVVGIITPWNVPLAISAWKIASALVTGCTVVYKPSSETPTVSYNLIDAYEYAGLPKGVFNFITGSGSVIGNGIAKHKDIKAISFTGSNGVGNIINNHVAARGARFQAEMGGKNPFVVLEDADLDLATTHVINGGLGESGQRCTATSRVILVKEIAEEFTEMLIKKVNNVKVGNPLNKETNMGPVINNAAVESILNYVKIGQEQGAKLLTGGTALNEGECANGSFVAPTVFTNVTPDMTIAQEEIFGPLISIMIAEDYDQALEWANDVEYGLSSAIYTNDMVRAMDFIDNIEAGLTHVNMMTMYSEPHFPFGGIKATGLGGFREVGSTGIDFYCEWKTVYIKPHSK